MQDVEGGPMALSDDLEKVLADLKTQRDELAVKANLAAKEVRDEWAVLEKRLDHLRGRAQVIGREAEDAAGEVAKAARQMVDEIKKGYARIRTLV
jgi:hypothetical protein